MFDRIQLENEWVRMEPIDEDHIPALARAGEDSDLWSYMPTPLIGESSFEKFVQFANAVHQRGEGLCFTTFDSKTNEVVGSSGFWNADLQHKRAEIGFTWLTASAQRTPINTACKLLMLEYGFEHLGLNRVEFKTDSFNQRSRAALKRIGAQEEGCHRCHMVMPDGRLRHSVYFSVIVDEWPDVKKNLLEKLARRY